MIDDDQEWRRMKRELDQEYQRKLKEVNDEAIAKLNAHKENHKIETQRM